MSSTAGSRLRGLAQHAAAPRPPRPLPEERCELCAEPLEPAHRHLIDVADRRILCACRPCSLLFDHRAAGGGHFKLLPDRWWYLDGFELDDVLWNGFGIPVELAFFFHSSAAERVVAFYPAPVGATESLLDLRRWDELVARNPVLERLQPDVEALLVDRTKRAREHWLVPVDRCYALVGMIRTHWRGLGGGPDVWREVEQFFEGLRRGARILTNDGKEGAWPSSGSASPR
jgi:Family of unknown function (DUF5947)